MSASSIEQCHICKDTTMEFTSVNILVVELTSWMTPAKLLISFPHSQFADSGNCETSPFDSVKYLIISAYVNI